MATGTPNTPVKIHISFKWIAIAVASILVIAACIRILLMHSVVANPGEEVVFVDKPYFWGKSGVRDIPLSVGRKTEFNTTSEIRISTIPAAYDVVLSHVPTRSGALVEIKYSISLRILNAPDLVERFGLKWYENSVEPKLMPLTRNVVGRTLAADLIGDATEVHQAGLRIADAVRQMLIEDGISVEVMGVSIKQIELTPMPAPKVVKTKAKA